MRRLVVGLVVLVTFQFGTQCGEGAIVFTDDVTFVDGDVYWSVEIYEDAHAEVLGGRFDNRLQLYDDSTATLLGGDIRGAFSMGGSSKASIYSGTYINTYIFMLDSAELDIYGGRMPDRFLDATAWGGNPLITFHGSNLQLDPLGGSQGDGVVTGIFADNTPFTVHLRGANTASRIRLAGVSTPAPVPEPSTLVVWSLLGVLGIVYGWRHGRKV